MKSSKTTGPTRRTHMFVGIVVLCGIPLSSCAVEPEPDTLDTPDTGQTEQAVTMVFPKCRVNGGPAQGLVCSNPGTSFIGNLTVVRAEAPPTSVANPIYTWVRRSTGGLLEDRGGCGPFDNFCVVAIQPGCDPANATRSALTQTGKVVKFAVGVSSSAGLVEAGTVEAFVANASDCSRPPDQLTACVPPASPPVLSIYTDYCGGRHMSSWSSVPNSSHYQVQTKPIFGSWDNVSDIPAYPGITIDVGGNSCRGDTDGDLVQRARACNDCGCSDWGNQATFYYFTGECS